MFQGSVVVPRRHVRDHSLCRNMAEGPEKSIKRRNRTQSVPTKGQEAEVRRISILLGGDSKAACNSKYCNRILHLFYVGKQTVLCGSL